MMLYADDAAHADDEECRCTDKAVAILEFHYNVKRDTSVAIRLPKEKLCRVVTKAGWI